MSAEEREICKQLVDETQASGASREKACELLGVSVRTVERWATRPEDLRKGPLTKPQNALTVAERNNVLAIANKTEFGNLPPCQIVPRLADQGQYVASESTFYRILKAENMLAHRSKSQPRKHLKPEALVAKGPNEIWAWDITFCTPGPSRLQEARRRARNMNGLRKQTKGGPRQLTALDKIVGARDSTDFPSDVSKNGLGLGGSEKLI